MQYEYKSTNVLSRMPFSDWLRKQSAPGTTSFCFRSVFEEDLD